MRTLAAGLIGSASLMLTGCDPGNQPADEMHAKSPDPVSEPPLRSGPAHPQAVQKGR